MKIKDASAVAFEVAMVLERETKDAVRYQELGEGGQPTDCATAKIGTLYEGGQAAGLATAKINAVYPQDSVPERSAESDLGSDP